MTKERRNNKSVQRASKNTIASVKRKKTFLKQLIAALICFAVLKYISVSSFSFSPSLKNTIKAAVTNDADLNAIKNIMQKLKFPATDITNN